MKNLVNNIIAANQRIKAVDGGARETPLGESAPKTIVPMDQRPAMH